MARVVLVGGPYDGVERELDGWPGEIEIPRVVGGQPTPYAEALVFTYDRYRRRPGWRHALRRDVSAPAPYDFVPQEQP
jgi:hypothetical protein